MARLHSCGSCDDQIDSEEALRPGRVLPCLTKESLNNYIDISIPLSIDHRVFRHIVSSRTDEIGYPFSSEWSCMKRTAIAVLPAVFWDFRWNLKLCTPVLNSADRAKVFDYELRSIADQLSIIHAPQLRKHCGHVLNSGETRTVQALAREKFQR